ncbi:MAG: L,D-transpeptidase catalytic domain [Smithella sp. PtaU1.Bin162]|nr:MAG: L,D-transpeptidase catalytic domain [Smithella sp. PtaU1.Bin162]
MLNKKLFGIYVIFFLFLFPLQSFSTVSTRAENIPDSIISVSSGYVIVVDKQYQKLYVFKKNGSFTKVFEAPCSTGKNQGAKQSAGDAKTPNGVFFATKILRNPGPPETYGTLAFPLDYPTLSDKRAGRNGNNIWIHGTTKPLTPLQSNGCVVLRDGDLHRLLDLIYFYKTPVIIQESINWISQNQIPSAKEDLERILNLWNKYSMDGDMKSFDALYLPGAEIKGKKREELIRKFKSLRLINNHFLLQPRDVSILRQENTAIIMFDQIAAINSDNSFQGSYNRLVLERLNNKWYVVDDVAAPPTTIVASTDKSSAGTVPKKDEPKTDARGEVAALVNKWVASWKSGDLKTFRSCYAANFKSKNMNLNEWVAHKNEVRRRSKNINIRIDNLRITVDTINATATFTQYYSSSILKSKSSKKLEIKKIEGEWKILRETT